MQLPFLPFLPLTGSFVSMHLELTPLHSTRRGKGLVFKSRSSEEQHRMILWGYRKRRANIDSSSHWQWHQEPSSSIYISPRHSNWLKSPRMNWIPSCYIYTSVVLVSVFASRWHFDRKSVSAKRRQMTTVNDGTPSLHLSLASSLPPQLISIISNDLYEDIYFNTIIIVV